MESEGEEGRVNLSIYTKELLEKYYPELKF